MTAKTLSPPDLNTLRIEIDGEIGTLTLDRLDVCRVGNRAQVVQSSGFGAGAVVKPRDLFGSRARR